MERSPADLMPRLHLLGSFTVWLLAALLFAGCVAGLEYRRLNTLVEDIADDLTHHLQLQLTSRDLVLENFSHYLSTLPEPDLDRARAYAASLLQHNSSVYMLALASRVPAADRDVFEQQMRGLSARGFSIHPAYEPGAQLPDSYYPVVLVEPELPEARGLLGMDLTQNSSVLSGLLGGDRVSGLSRPIALGDSRGYLLFHAIEPGLVHSETARSEGYSHYALLVVRASSLVPVWALDMPGLSLRLRHPDVSLGERGLLLEQPGLPEQQLSLPSFKRLVSIPDEAQPLQLEIRYQPPWQVLDVWLVAGLAAAGLLLILQGGWVMLSVSRTRHRLLEQQQTLYDKAHYDHLTGLPNTNLLIDRLEQAVRSAQRTGSRVAVFFLDLDDFKKVNDRWGHDIGDQLLIQIGVRLRESMRSEDTVARIHGDEFVILIPVLDGEGQLAKVQDKLETLFATPFCVGDLVLIQSGSIGLAVFPEDAEDAEALLGLADRQMYQRKQSRDSGDISAAVGS